MAKSISMTLDDETLFYLEFLVGKKHLRNRVSAKGIVVQDLIHGQIGKMKIVDRPDYQKHLESQKKVGG